MIDSKERRDDHIIPEVVLASEQVQFDNIQAITLYVKESRRVVNELNDKVTALQNIVVMQNEKINGLQKQLAGINQQLYSNGTSR